MEIKLEHHFKNTCYDVDELFDGVKNIAKFLKNLDKQCKKNPAMWEPDKYKGDGFEAFVEALIKLNPVNTRINIQNYHPTIVDEKGIDGVGETFDGEVATVQAKCSMNSQKYITETHENIAMFPAYSFAKYQAKQMTLFTTAKDLHPVLENFDNTVTVIGYKDIQKLVDHPAFWQNFYNLMLDK